MSWKHFVLPHPKTHKKAHLISWYGLLSYLLIFVLLQTSISWLAQIKPGVLGVSTVINYQEVIRLTNIEREKRGLQPLREDARLNDAAANKAENMYSENYWAHFSPSGKDPWGFIHQSGYKFSVAGENLAKNFYTPEEVVQAWMESPTHRDNLLSPKYVDIGIAVAEGELNGQKTILVVQEFGREEGFVAMVDNNDSKPTVQAAGNQEASSLGISESAGFSIDPYVSMKVMGFGVIGIIGGLLVTDLYVLRRRAVYRLSARHVPQLALLGVSGVGLWQMGPGQIL
jgi:hypothetical protein